MNSSVFNNKTLIVIGDYLTLIIFKGNIRPRRMIDRVIGSRGSTHLRGLAGRCSADSRLTSSRGRRFISYGLERFVVDMHDGRTTALQRTPTMAIVGMVDIRMDSLNDCEE